MTFDQWNLLYSIYSFPNIILPIIGGLLVDKYLGKKLGLVLFTTIVALG